jgi:acyl carrier protein
VPAIGTLAALVLVWHVGWPGAVALWLFAGFYLVSAIGVEIGFHRYFTHRAFKCGPALRLLLAAFGSTAGEGPVLFGAATHRRHHSHSDTEQDPHGPNRPGFAGFWRAHVGWLFEPQPQDTGRYVPDLIRDRTTSLANRLYPLWFALGLALPAAIGFAFRGRAGCARGTAVGRDGPHLRRAPGDLEHQFDVPPVRRAAVRHPRRQPQFLAARAADAGRGMAQQPPRLPAIGIQRLHLVAGGSVGLAHSIGGRARTGMGRTAAAGPIHAGRPSGMSVPDTTTTGGFETITAAALEAWIANWLVRNADVPAADIKRDLEFFDYGLDSLHAVDLSGHLEELLGRPLSPSLAWEFPTISGLAAHLAAGGSGTQEDLDAS